MAPKMPHVSLLTGIHHTIKNMGDMPVGLLLMVPRMSLSYAVVGSAMICRAAARMFGTTSSYEPKANLRILIVTDYMPPQTHGIAIRFRQYIDFMRRAGHEVHVFCTNSVRETETSFDHPNLPAITNPYNTRNKMAYTSGVKLAWYLSAKQWDIVHVVCPSNICWAVLPVVAWRRIPCYVSHHVDMEYYIYEYVKLKVCADVGWVLYWVLTKLPCMLMAQCNAAPTLTFLDAHISKSDGILAGGRKRIPSGVAVERFKVDSPAQLRAERAALVERAQLPAGSDACVLLMVQRLAPEKGTMRALEALARLKEERAGTEHGPLLSLDGKRPVHLMIAGDGPSLPLLTAYAAEHALPVTFLGNVPNGELPQLYRVADVFVTCSTSETYGLTVLESLACGTPVVLPHCGVFDELWVGRIPDEWIFRDGDAQSLLTAMRAAGDVGSRPHLAAHPIKASWADATEELLSHYMEIIKSNLPMRQTRATYLGAFDSLMRALIVALLASWVVKSYTKKAFKIGFWLIDDVFELFA